MSGRSLQDWLRFQESLHPAAIDLGLERVSEVWERMGVSLPDVPVITVAGTNGKGSIIAFLEHMYRAAGATTASYTSPHLLQYNERVCIKGEPVTDETLVEAFGYIDSHRAGVSLTYFEFGTLAALYVFARAQVDIILLEVGLGGRLDAVNIIDADVAIISNIGMDHTEWLGDTREQIAREKCGIARAGRPLVAADRHPPASLYQCAEDAGAKLFLPGREFSIDANHDGWSLVMENKVYRDLPRPGLAGEYQLDNATSAVVAVELLQDRLAVGQSAISRGLANTSLPGRFQLFGEQPQVILDVAHNPDAAAKLAGNLVSSRDQFETFTVLAMQKNRLVEPFVEVLYPQVDHWYPCAFGPGAHLPSELAGALARQGNTPITQCRSVAEAVKIAARQAKQGTRVLVTGSFYTVAEAIRALQD